MPRRRTPRPAWVIARRVALSHRIAALRIARGLSQDQLADRAGVERRSIQRYEGAISDPQFSDLVLIAAGLDIPIEDLVREEDPRAATRDVHRPGQ
ncbi:helix-turn-helix domain-containing protein [Streptomyces sp. NPDC058280]|uniref:helix-turn-helix domain-containing protein n=1 Tax=Streptomyces sp. NPDC058280 TaxID=3346419 RepID=UPI0036E59D62